MEINNGHPRVVNADKRKFPAQTEVFGLVHIENRQMLTMADDLGFKLRMIPDDPSVREVVWHPQGVTAHASLS